MPGNEQRKTFFVCAWNSYTKGEWDDDPIAAAIRSFLISRDWNEGGVEDARLIVVAPRNEDKHLSVEDLVVYSAGLAERRKAVLYIHVGTNSPFSFGASSPWLYFLRNAGFKIEDLEFWLDSLAGCISDAASDQFEPYPFSDVKERLNDIDAEARKATLTEDSLVFSRTGQRLIAGENSAQVFYGLCRVAAGYDVLEHDINALKAMQHLEPTEKAKNLFRKQFLDSLFDLRSAIVAHSNCQTLAETGDKEAPNIVLLIDDRPEKIIKEGNSGNSSQRLTFAAELHNIIRKYLPGMELRVWNPDDFSLSNVPINDSEKSSLVRRSFLEQYSSLRHRGGEAAGDQNSSPRWSLTVKRVCAGNNSLESEEQDLINLLARTRVILVDLLFTDASGKDVEAGLGIIRGLQRFCRDRYKEIKLCRAKHDKTNQAQWTIPQVVAISRASDLAKAHAVHRLGAGGYVLKERLMRLPAEIVRNLRTNFDWTVTSHRNFRLLYNLPHETIGLLGSTLVPRISFHRPEERPLSQHESKRNRAFSELFACLPKTDLHVHAGSCMSPEFLLIASFIMLLRHKFEDRFMNNAKRLVEFWRGKAEFKLTQGLAVKKGNYETISFIPRDGEPEIRINAIATYLREFLKTQIQTGEANRKNLDPDLEQEKSYHHLRSVLHEHLKLSDYKNEQDIIREIDSLHDAELFFFALTHAWREEESVILDKNDCIRLFLLWLGSGRLPRRRTTNATNTPDECAVYSDAALVIEEPSGSIHSFALKDFPDNVTPKEWDDLHNMFYGEEGVCSFAKLRKANWSLSRDALCKVKVTLGGRSDRKDYLADCPKSDDDPIAWLLASGVRSSNLREYLEGCEYSGAKHVKHPFLIHLFAQQTVHEFVRQGVLYAELRAAIVGYSNEKWDFSFSDACNCFRMAFVQAQTAALDKFGQKPAEQAEESCWLWNSCFDLNTLFDPFLTDFARYRFPCKVSVILTGKRHKPTRLLLREAGAGALLHARPLKSPGNAVEFVEKAIPDCRIVGFDLSGHEDKYPPYRFQNEYDQIWRMHIPITVHAGENADVSFVESAILDLRARRLGHGLALTYDYPLLARARDEGVCLELCPVSNFQTNTVSPPGEPGFGREYPLRKFLDEDLNLCINTDNPIISNTNMVKECFQASYAFGKPGLSLWELLGIIRLGFTQSFLTLPERRSLLEIADQIVFDLFSNDDVLAFLRSVRTDGQDQ